MANPKKAPKWWLIIGILTFLLGIGGCGGATFAGARFANKITDAPGADFGETLDFTSSSAIAVVFADSSLADCDVADENGNRVPLTADTGGYESEVDGYQLIDAFETDSGSAYEVTCDGPSRGSFKVVEFDGSLIAIAIGGVVGGAVLLFLGFVFVIIGIIRRYSWNKKRKAGVYGGGGPSGGMPAPGGYGTPPAPGGYGTPPAPGGYATPPAPGGYTPPPAPGGYGTPPAPGQVMPPPAPGQQPPPA